MNITDAVKKVYERVNSELEHLGGLDNHHIKVITYYISEVLGFKNFRFEIKYLETPKKIIIHIYSENGQFELYCKPKPADLFDIMVKNMGIPDWKIQFAERSN